MNLAHSDKPVLYELLQQASNELTDYAIGFANLVENGELADAELRGSGTLVSVDGRCAVVTADHVLENLPSSGEVGLILPTRFKARLHRVTLDMELAQKVHVARGSLEAEGPDIGVLILPIPIVTTIRVGKSFYGLGSRINRHQVPTDRGFWLICGMAHEWTCDAPSEHGYRRVKIFRGICGAGIVGSERVVGEFDYLDFQTRYDEVYEGPQSYGGFSGGGLWQVIIARTPSGELKIQEKILSGVIFYQSALENNSRTIVCHGRQSVYGAVVDAIRNAA